MSRNFLLTLLGFLTTIVYAQKPKTLSIHKDPKIAVDSNFFDHVPTIDYGKIFNTSSKTTFTTRFEPSGSTWGPNLDEKNVYLARLKHNSNDTNNWDLRLGKGGQIYSFIGPYGEGVPPSYKSYNSQWNDEVWQPVSVVTSLSNDDGRADFKNDAIIDGGLKYFIHGAGTYLNKVIDKAFYSPLMASYYNKKEKAYYVTNWGVQAHIPSLFKSGILYTTKYKDIGEGILEVTYLVQNFGTDTMNHLNVPWGGVRSSNLRGMFVSNRDNSLTISKANTARTTDAINIDQTGGYFIYAKDTESESSPALGIVFGDKILKNEFASHKLANIYFRNGQVGPDNNARDYTLFTVITKVNVKPGETFYYRMYYINGTRADVHEKSKKLTPYSNYGFITPAIENTPRVTIKSCELNYALDQNMDLFTSPVKDMIPLFLMRNTSTGEEYISPDLYYNVTTAPFSNPYSEDNPKYNTYQNRITYKVYDGKIEYIRLLGYASNIDLSTSKTPYALLDNMILDNSKVVLTEAYKNKLWIPVGHKLKK